jgi:hypothetical protein
VKLNEQKEISELAIGDFDTAKKVGMKTHAKTLIGNIFYSFFLIIFNLTNSFDKFQLCIFCIS